MNCVLDIEAIPGQSEYVTWAMDNFTATQQHPKNYKSQEAIDKWYATTGKEQLEEYRHKMGLDATTGEIVTIGWKCDDDPTTAMGRGNHSEGDLLQHFFDLVDRRKVKSHTGVTFVGHNLIKFDLPYIWRRSKILGIQVPAYLPPPSELKPWSTNVFDTMVAWAGPQGSISLDKLCRVLGIEGKGGMDGSNVYKYYKDGRQAEIDAYCMEDVMKCWQIAQRLM